MRMLASERFTVRGEDGVAISVMRKGAGPALLLVHGAMLNSLLTWATVLPVLARRFTVYAIDRRGRPPSGDGEQYSLAVEAADIVRVMEAIDRPLTVLAHSYGALATLEGLEQLKYVHRLILYEPPVILTPPTAEDIRIVDDMDRALAEGDRARVVELFVLDRLGAPPARMAGLRSSMAWPLVLEIASTLPRESRTTDIFRNWTPRLSACAIPMTFLMGEKTTDALRDSSLFVSSQVSGSRLMILEGQAHAGMIESPNQFLNGFFEAVDG